MWIDSLTLHLGCLGHALPHVGIKNTLAETKVVWSHFDEFIGVDIFDGAFKGELKRGGELRGVFLGGGANVIELLSLDWVDWKVIGAGVFADDHAGVNFLGGVDEEGSAALEGEE